MTEAALMLRQLSLPWADGERMRSVLDRTARLARLTYWRTSDIWYGKARRIEPFEVEQIAEALRIKSEKAARNEFHELKLRLAKLEASLSARDPDFYSPDVDYLRSLARRSSPKDRAMDRER